jgi:hypothetical protein
MMITKHPVAYGIGYGTDPFSNFGYGMNSRYGATIALRGLVTQIGMPFSNSGTVNEAGGQVGFMADGESTPTYDGYFNTEAGNNLMFTASDNSTIRFNGGGSSIPHTLSWDGGAGKESSGLYIHLGNAQTASSLTGISTLRHIWNPSTGFGSPAIKVGIMTRAPYGSATTSAINQWLYNAPRGATMWFYTGATGWISSSAPSTATNNYAFMDSVVYGGSELARTFTQPQRAAAYTANPPGYTGPAIRTSNTMTVNVYY